MSAVRSTLHLFPRLFFQKATITTTGAHVHAVKNARNWIEDVTVAGRKLVWLREGGEMLLNAKERVARLHGYVNLFEIILLFC